MYLFPLPGYLNPLHPLTLNLKHRAQLDEIFATQQEARPASKVPRHSALRPGGYRARTPRPWPLQRPTHTQPRGSRSSAHSGLALGARGDARGRVNSSTDIYFMIGATLVLVAGVLSRIRFSRPELAEGPGGGREQSRGSESTRKRRRGRGAGGRHRSQRGSAGGGVSGGAGRCESVGGTPTAPRRLSSLGLPLPSVVGGVSMPFDRSAVATSGREFRRR